MFGYSLWEPLRAYWARKRLERLQYQAAERLLGDRAESTRGRRRLLSEGPEPVEEDPDADAWRLVGLAGKELDERDRQTIRDKARFLADYNPYARNILTLYRNYTVGTGMRHEVVPVRSGIRENSAVPQIGILTNSATAVARVSELWQEFIEANDWSTGNRKDWEFCLRTWRDGECFLRLFRQGAWPPRVHFVDPEHVAPDPATGLPTDGIETTPGNVEEVVAYLVHVPSMGPIGPIGPIERVEASRILHTKIGVDANVKRGVSIFLPVLDGLKRFHGWLDAELIHRKLAASIVYVRKHEQNYPAGLSAFADAAATSVSGSGTAWQRRRLKLEPGTVVDVQGFDLQTLSPDSHFDDASLLGRMILLSVAAGTGLPEFMLSADASNANYASTLVAEGPAVRHFAAWQAFFIGQWRNLFRMVLREAVVLGLLRAAEAKQVALAITPPTLAVRNRHQEAKADALYYDRGALSARELARRDGADPDVMQRERNEEKDDKMTR